MTRITKTNDIDPQRLQSFIEQLQNCKGPRIYATEYRSIFASCFPHRPRATESRQWLLDALQHAATTKVIRLPVAHGKCWERDLHPALPTYVTLVRIAPARQATWQHFPWHPRLAWVATLHSLAPDQERFLHRVHSGLVRDEFSRLAPLKYRSLTLTGDEKALGSLAKSVLFRHDRLSFSLLGCVPDFPPLVIEKLSDQPNIIVFENVGSYRVAHEVLLSIKKQKYGMIAFGGGAGFKKSVLSLGQIKHKIDYIEYVGDLDRPGLDIATYATSVSQRENLPPIIAASDVHRAMIESSKNLGYPIGTLYQQDNPSSSRDSQLTSWLSPDIREHIQDVLKAERRIPEEVLGPDELLHLWG
ncbi:MAG TPA: hypothetical protein VFS21_35250 [Roseiflexaceae bacterium]|nr:hypothetical protein [Roseiflexaceae bacterium]